MLKIPSRSIRTQKSTNRYQHILSYNELSMVNIIRQGFRYRGAMLAYYCLEFFA